MSGTEGVFIQRRSFAPFAAHGDNEKGIGNYVEGESLHLECCRSEPFIDAVSAPVLAPVAWEGPYVRVYPSINTGQVRNATKRWWQGSSIQRASDGAAVVPSNGERAPFFEFDAQPGIVLNFPFDCEVSLYTELSGLWAFNMTVLRRPDAYANSRGGQTGMGQTGPRAARLHPQTRLVYGLDAPRTRRVIVPLGCKEVSPVGEQDVNARPMLTTNTAAVTAFGGTNVIPLVSGARSPDGYRYPIGGSRSVLLSTGGVTGLVSGVTFWCEL